jgi:class 3 adenylate cyclase/tetratricopeptide (TPR) repeat protein
MNDSVTRWLEELGLGQYAEAFEDGAIDWGVLPDLDHEILKELGVHPPGHRLRILKAIQSLEPGESVENAHISGGVVPKEGTATSGDAERRQLTVMFCDLVGSTELSQQLDPEDMREVNRAYQDACKAAIERYEGYVARYMGDGILAYFGYPQAHEDDAERAIHAALAIVDSVTGLRSPDAGSQIELAVRLGIATGPVVVGDLIGEGASQENAVVGDTPNLAARLQALCTPNTIVVSPGTHELASGRFEYESLGNHELKGISDAVHAWRVVASASTESRFEAAHRAGYTPLVGRENEINLLLERWQQAKDGDGQIILLSGEAGIGKSRITETLRERTSDDDPTRLRYQCSPYHTNSALYPIIQSLEHAAQLRAEDDSSTRLDKLASLLARGTSDTKAVLSLVGPLLSIQSDGRYTASEMTAEQQKVATLQILVEQMDGLSRRGAVLMVFEDAHWADPTSLELLELIIERVQALPIMVVITFRPEFTPPWTMHSHVTALTLNRFTRALAAAMVEKVSAGATLSDEVLDQIIEKTDGVPLFVEELTKTILESGAVSDAVIPATLHDSLMARLDRLGAVKEVAQSASVIGREFDFDLLATVSPLSFAALHDALSQLVDAELVFRRTRMQGEMYIFKHALVQDAAYESLLKSTRRDLHRRIAESLQARFPEIAEAQPELLGRHYTEAGIPDKALASWHRAAERAVERSANLEAITYFNKALSLIDALSETRDRHRLELTLQTGIAGPLIAIEGYGAWATGQAFARAQELSAVVGASADLFPVMYGRWVYGVSWQKYEDSLQVAKQFVDLAHKQSDTGPILMAHRVTGVTQFQMGRPRDAQENLSKVFALYDPVEHAPLRFKFGQDPYAAALAFSSLCLWQLGYPEQAESSINRSIERAHELDHINTIAYVKIFGASVLYHLNDNLSALEEITTDVASLAEEHGLAMWKTLISVVDGWLAARRDRDPSGICRMREGLDAAEKTFTYEMPYRLSLLAGAHLACGEPDAGIEVIDEALEMAVATGDRSFEAELYRVKAELLLSSSRPPAEAESCLLDSLRVAKDQDARLFELRSATMLARLWADDGRRDKAAELLVPTFNWFTEGFQTPTLKAARSLLDQLT